MECSNLLLLNSLLKELYYNFVQGKLDPMDPKNQEFEPIKTKITLCVNNVVLQSPIDLTNDTQKLKRKWENFCTNTEIAYTADNIYKSVELIQLVSDIWRKSIFSSVNNLKQPSSDNVSDVAYYLSQKQVLLDRLDLINAPYRPTSHLPNIIFSIDQGGEQEVELQLEIEQEKQETETKSLISSSNLLLRFS